MYQWTHHTEAGCQEWMLKRNCSLSPAQLAIWFASLACLSLSISLVFAAMGAWLVVPFAVIEITALGVAFFVFGRHAADYERIIAEPGKISIETSFGPKLDRVEQQAPWFRVEYSGRHRDLVRVMGPGYECQIGRFVPGSIRGKLAGELRRAVSPPVAQVSQASGSVPLTTPGSAQY